jgi:hypothetical protein
VGQQIIISPQIAISIFLGLFHYQIRNFLGMCRSANCLSQNFYVNPQIANPHFLTCASPHCKSASFCDEICTIFSYLYFNGVHFVIVYIHFSLKSAFPHILCSLSSCTTLNMIPSWTWGKFQRFFIMYFYSYLHCFYNATSGSSFERV